MQKVCDDSWVDMQTRRGVHGEIPLSEDLALLSGPLISHGKAFDSFLPCEYSMVKKLLPAWAARAVDLGAVKSTVQKQAFERKQNLKDKVDANMVDADEVACNEALRAEIPLALKEEQKKQKVSSVRETVEGKLSNMTLGKRQREAETGAEQPALTGAEKCQKITQTQPFVCGRRQSTAPKEGKGILVEELRNRNFIYGKPSSYPDELLELPEADTLKIILSKEPSNSFCSGLFSRGIHVGLGVSSVPKNIELIIAKGHVFSFLVASPLLSLK